MSARYSEAGRRSRDTTVPGSSHRSGWNVPPWLCSGYDAHRWANGASSLLPGQDAGQESVLVGLDGLAVLE